VGTTSWNVGNRRADGVSTVMKEYQIPLCEFVVAEMFTLGHLYADFSPSLGGARPETAMQEAPPMNVTLKHIQVPGQQLSAGPPKIESLVSQRTALSSL